jgi:hypothetical protein
MVVLLRWEEQRHLVKMRKKKPSYRGLWKCRCVCVVEPISFFGVTGEYRLMSQPRGQVRKMFKSSTEEHTRIVQNGGMGLCEFKRSKRKWVLRLARNWFVRRQVSLVHELDRRGRLSRSIAAISAASDQGFAQKDVRAKYWLLPEDTPEKLTYIRLDWTSTFRFRIMSWAMGPHEVDFINSVSNTRQRKMVVLI